MSERPAGGVQSDEDGPRPDWVTSLIDRMVHAVERIRSATTQPAVTASRGLIYGLVAAVCLMTALVLVGLGLFRLADLVLPGKSWAAHLCAGGFFCLSGGLLWRRRLSTRPTG